MNASPPGQAHPRHAAVAGPLTGKSQVVWDCRGLVELSALGTTRTSGLSCLWSGPEAKPDGKSEPGLAHVRVHALKSDQLRRQHLGHDNEGGDRPPGF